MSYQADGRSGVEAEDASLIDAARAGDRKAMERLLTNHQDRVYRTALGLLGNPESALEVAQEVLISASRRLDQFRGESKFSTWLYRMTVNFAKNWKVADGRRAARFVSIDAPHDQDAEERAPSRDLRDRGPDVRTQAADSEMIAILHSRLQALSEEFRAPLVLHFIEDRPYDEIAELLGIALGTVKSRIHRGRAELRRAMADVLESRRASS
ncbi:RNA polymerase sigma factor RpoE [soil metagenome]